MGSATPTSTQPSGNYVWTPSGWTLPQSTYGDTSGTGTSAGAALTLQQQQQQAAMQTTAQNMALLSQGYRPSGGGWVNAQGQVVASTTQEAVAKGIIPAGGILSTSPNLQGQPAQAPQPQQAQAQQNQQVFAQYQGSQNVAYAAGATIKEGSPEQAYAYQAGLAYGAGTPITPAYAAAFAGLSKKKETSKTPAVQEGAGITAPPTRNPLIASEGTTFISDKGGAVRGYEPSGALVFDTSGFASKQQQAGVLEGLKAGVSPTRGAGVFYDNPPPPPTFEAASTSVPDAQGITYRKIPETSKDIDAYRSSEGKFFFTREGTTDVIAVLDPGTKTGTFKTEQDVMVKGGMGFEGGVMPPSGVPTQFYIPASADVWVTKDFRTGKTDYPTKGVTYLEYAPKGGLTYTTFSTYSVGGQKQLPPGVGAALFGLQSLGMGGSGVTKETTTLPAGTQYMTNLQITPAIERQAVGAQARAREAGYPSATVVPLFEPEKKKISFVQDLGEYVAPPTPQLAPSSYERAQDIFGQITEAGGKTGVVVSQALPTVWGVRALAEGSPFFETIKQKQVDTAYGAGEFVYGGLVAPIKFMQYIGGGYSDVQQYEGTPLYGAAKERQRQETGAAATEMGLFAGAAALFAGGGQWLGVVKPTSGTRAYTVTSTDFAPTAKVSVVAGEPLDVGGIAKAAPTRLTMGTQRTEGGVAVEIRAQQGLFSTVKKAEVPSDYIPLTTKDVGYARLTRTLQPETQAVYPHSTTTPFNVKISTGGVGGIKTTYQGAMYETQLPTSAKLQPFEQSVSVGRGGIEPAGKAKVVSIKEYYIEGEKVGARTNVETYYLGLATEVKTPIGKGYELPFYKQTSKGTFELLPEGQGKMITSPPTAEPSGTTLIQTKSSALGFIQESPAFKSDFPTYVSGKGGTGKTIDVSGSKFLYPEQEALGGGTTGGFRVGGKLGAAPMDMLVIADKPPIPKTIPKNVGDIQTISFHEGVINPKKSMEFVGAEAIPAPKTPAERVISFKDMGGLSVEMPKARSAATVQVQRQDASTIFKEATKEGNALATMLPPSSLKAGTKPSEATIQLPLAYQTATQTGRQTEKTYQPPALMLTTYQPATAIFKTYQPPSEVSKVYQPPAEVLKTYQPPVEILKVYQPPAQVEKVLQPQPEPERTKIPPSEPSIFVPPPPPPNVVPPYVPPPEVPPPFGGGGFPLGGGSEMTGFKAQLAGARKGKYQPSMTAVLFGIRGAKGRSEMSGFALRPIPTGKAAKEPKITKEEREANSRKLFKGAYSGRGNMAIKDKDIKRMGGR